VDFKADFIGSAVRGSRQIRRGVLPAHHRGNRCCRARHRYIGGSIDSDVVPALSAGFHAIRPVRRGAGALARSTYRAFDSTPVALPALIEKG